MPATLRLQCAPTLRTRGDESIARDVFARLEQLVLESFDHVIGLDLTRLAVDGCCAKAPNAHSALNHATESPMKIRRGRLHQSFVAYASIISGVSQPST